MIAALIAAGSIYAAAQEPADTTMHRTLNEVVAEGQNQQLQTTKSIFFPTKQQKKTSMSGTDLLRRMAIPMLKISPASESIEAAAGGSVTVFIDYIRATPDEIRMMLPTDVQRVDYYDYPSDPRFQGAAHAVNFIMKKREYGGYVKALGKENFIVNTGTLQANLRLNRRRMTYDVMGYAGYESNSHRGNWTNETFNLPNDDGTMRLFDKTADIDNTKLRNNSYQAAFRAKYSSSAFTANNLLTAGLERTPRHSERGSATYSDGIYHDSYFESQSTNRSKFIRLNGQYYWQPNKSNALAFDLSGELSEAHRNSNYAETNFPVIDNAAADNSEDISGKLSLSHDFGSAGNLGLFGKYLYQRNNTHYSGSCVAYDKSTTHFGQAGANYSFAKRKFRGYAGFGWCWLATDLNEIDNFSNYPFADLSLSYTFNNSNSLQLDSHYSVWPPSSNYKSENIVQVSPFLWHTGNPTLTSHKSYDMGLRYTCIPSSKFNFSAFASLWALSGREAFAYRPYDNGVLRTLVQPAGGFARYSFGLSGATRQLNGKLQLSANVSGVVVDDKEFDYTRGFVSFWVQAYYYLGDFNFSAAYISRTGDIDSYQTMSGAWREEKDDYLITVGWSRSGWNLKLTIHDIGRWNWNSATTRMETPHYSRYAQIAGPSHHALIQLSVAYTIGFGKKVDSRGDLTKQSSGSSGILY